LNTRTQRDVFCVNTKTVRAPSPWPHLAHPAYVGHWTVSDGCHVVEATLHEVGTADDFTIGVADLHRAVYPSGRSKLAGHEQEGSVVVDESASAGAS
jgi:hypothetical protein